MRAAAVVQVLQDLFWVLFHVLFYLWSLLNVGIPGTRRRMMRRRRPDFQRRLLPNLWSSPSPMPAFGPTRWRRLPVAAMLSRVASRRRRNLVPSDDANATTKFAAAAAAQDVSAASALTGRPQQSPYPGRQLPAYDVSSGGWWPNRRRSGLAVADPVEADDVRNSHDDDWREKLIGSSAC